MHSHTLSKTTSRFLLLTSNQCTQRFDLRAPGLATVLKSEQRLASISEIKAHVLWRFLHLRNFVDAGLQLTPWGSVLRTTLTALGPDSNQEDAAFLAIELLRLNVLTADTLFPEYSGAPSRGSSMSRR